ncbi:MAG: RimK family alpha-L-glutamate ligase [Methermicoccaceae archaeon]
MTENKERSGIQIGIMGSASDRSFKMFLKESLTIGRGYPIDPACLFSNISSKDYTMGLDKVEIKNIIDSIDVLLIRDVVISPKDSLGFRLETLSAIEQQIPVVNSPDVIIKCANKYATSLSLTKKKIPVPDTFVTQSTEGAIRFIERVGKAVIKPLYGHGGEGVELLESEKIEDIQYSLNKILQQRGVLYLQRFVETGGHDIRVFVVDGQVEGAMRRSAEDGWVTNLSRGGMANTVELSNEEVEMAISSADAVGALFCGVDMVRDVNDGALVLEVNATPSIDGISKLLGRSLAIPIMEMIDRIVKT